MQTLAQSCNLGAQPRILSQLLREVRPLPLPLRTSVGPELAVGEQYEQCEESGVHNSLFHLISRRAHLIDQPATTFEADEPSVAAIQLARSLDRWTKHLELLFFNTYS